MSLQNRNIPFAKVSFIGEIIEHIAVSSGGKATAALACTCTQLYEAISNNNSLWYKLYHCEFHSTNSIKFDWIQWHLEHEHAMEVLKYSSINTKTNLWDKLYKKVDSNNTYTKYNRLKWQSEQQCAILKTTDDLQSSMIKKCIWWQRYKQRRTIKLNWQTNQPTWAFNILSAKKDKPLKINKPEARTLCHCPGWMFYLDSVTLKGFLVDFSESELPTAYEIDWIVDSSSILISSRFTNSYQGKYGAKGMVNSHQKVFKHSWYLMLEVFTSNEKTRKLQIWNISNRELLRTIKIEYSYSPRIFGSILIYSNHMDEASQQYPNGSVTLMTDIFTPPPYSPGFIIIPKDNNNQMHIILAINDDYVNLLCYNSYENGVSYKIVQLSTTAASDVPRDDEVNGIITIASGHLPIYYAIANSRIRIDYLDYNHILLERTYRIPTNIAKDLDTNAYQGFMTAISASMGTVWDEEYPVHMARTKIVISEYNLCVLEYHDSRPLAVISLIDGSLQYPIYTQYSYEQFTNFERVVDSLIAGCDYEHNRYCIIDVLTGRQDVHSFPIPSVSWCKFTFGHMILVNHKQTLVVRFVPNFT
ncbi:hypothetical protein BDF19DRAFT_438475 [Syncephalis fuscata]|nr:hypothetical protein BDF19DRAFT_438475 [Syncephalis fuscata]